MISAGIDIGSRTVKVAIAENGKIIHSGKTLCSYNPVESCKMLLSGIEYDTLTATGYGRHLIKQHIDCSVISEIRAFSIGSSFHTDGCRTILDIGGQDTKAISLDESGNVAKFEMNDKCAAGTGRFLEIMAAALGYTPEDFYESALSADKAEQINNTCTVFAESEVISLISRGVPRNGIALGIHQSMSSRAISLLRRVNIKDKIVFAGGVAFNRCMVSLIEKELDTEISIPPDPQIIGAEGCALFGQVNKNTKYNGDDRIL